ncbi:hemerythrin domain-containing protein [Rhodovulum strictum]|uniref:Hemerythrin-like domain-containing protein n=1 Tax=Rhodovulum strictum TaxID=58314 RepID=A0A844B064_9RHOB|nr:hemerythrin domain-containing protein [Rhodovulum strictum]MRH19766.1 hypothetical protein [Rhodovulum strictum]
MRTRFPEITIDGVALAPTTIAARTTVRTAAANGPGNARAQSGCAPGDFGDAPFRAGGLEERRTSFARVGSALASRNIDLAPGAMGPFDLDLARARLNGALELAARERRARAAFARMNRPNNPGWPGTPAGGSAGQPALAPRDTQPRSQEFGPVPVDLRNHADPLDAIAADHLRQRQMAGALERLAHGQVPCLEHIIGLLAHVDIELPVNFLDEEVDLFDLLRRRAGPRDRPDWLLDRLAAEHAVIDDLAGEVSHILRSVITGRTPPDMRALGRFAVATRRHLIVDETLILPLARMRLSQRDRQDLRAAMAARRGLPPATARGTIDA